jgi:hypothetical protein
MIIPAALLAITLALCASVFAQEPGCLETSTMGKMAGATSIATLKARKQEAGDSYRAQVIYAARMLEIDPNNKSAAELLLNLIPKDIDGPQQKVWLELDELPQCPSGNLSDSDLMPLFRLQYHLPRLLARAVLLVPDKMQDYVTYAYISIQNPESDYAIQMQKVCRVKHLEFVSAVDKMPLDDKKWFVAKIFNPDGCHPLAFPEQ